MNSDPKQKLLDAAEVLFAQNGFEGASLRMITNEAGVNIASANYHFGSKEKLFMETVRRRVEPVNEERVELLQKLRQEGTLTLENVVHALLWPLAKMLASPNAVRFMGRCMSEAAPLQQKIFSTFFSDVGKAFIEAMGEAMPELPRKELHWRFHFTVSLMSGAFSQHERLAVLLPQDYQNVDSEVFLQRLSSYMIAGIKAGGTPSQ